jgi:hypothetical protein
MRSPDNNAIIAQYPGPEQLLAAPASEVERILLRHIIEYCRDGMHPMTAAFAPMNRRVFSAYPAPICCRAFLGSLLC